MKKLKVGDPTIIWDLIDKELEPHGITVKDLKEKYPDSLVEGKPWYQYYSFKTEGEFESWRNYCIVYLRTRVSPKISKKEAEEQFSWIDLMYGLKQEYKHDKEGI